MQRLRMALVGVAATCLVLPLGVGSAVAHGDDDVLDVEVLVTGLDGPRGLALDHRENVWIAQSGRGGDGPCFVGAEGPTCLGATGKISVLVEDDDRGRGRDRDRQGRGDSHGHGHGHDDGYSLRDVVTGLPSLALQGTEDNPIGPTDVAFDRRGRLLATVGLGADPGVRTLSAEEGGLGGSALALELATVRRVDVRSGTTSLVADIGAFELGENPEPEDFDTNPFSLAVHKNTTLVADAGGNTLLRVARDGGVETVFTFPKEAPVQNPFAPPGTTIEADAVPNSVVRGPDGAFYVGQLTGFPFTVGAATVWRFEHGEEPTVYADGFTNIIDLAFDDHGNLLVLEIARNGLLAATGPAQDWSGALIKVSRRDPSRHTVLLTDPLFAPSGIVVDDDDAYISNRSNEAGAGEILKIELDD
ncbi:ScyD/ScyE family protein [Cellulomonas sp. ATA003]|uniref:ScyD/ScyE family protein n=1 Tax=Cellulomonas sp. ATA003 TaxID=3073064 RepID=UPI0028732D40|nr:ScyD/ScyE family protein [Cellulomonas sp. ATA003]WNB87057.1 ScyD/ScyE family protein [Cellulomonas sp. ATA003]